MQDLNYEALRKAGYNRVPVVREVLADTETPLSIYLKLANTTYSYLFESIQGGEKWGRFSIIGLQSNIVLRVVERKITVEKDGVVTESLEVDDPFPFIAEFKNRYRVAGLPSGTSFGGGLVGYFGYDTVRYAEPIIGKARGKDDLATPDILLMVSEEVIVFDNLKGTISFVINADPNNEGSFKKAQSRIDSLQNELKSPLQLPVVDPRSAKRPINFSHHFTQENFETSVNTIKDYIDAGDVMQVVISQRMSASFDGDPLNVYRALRYLNPSPYMVYFDLGDHHIVSSSPEILARVEDKKITVRPLAGTRKRGLTEDKDQALEQELLNDTKELAEHLMLIDLSRNDSGRVSKVGTVNVARQMFIERYSHVMHIASIVESELSEDKSALDVLRSTLPVGTLSGAPKVRAMEIIDQLEPEKRGVYGGAMGYLGWNDNMDMAIAIRTAVIKDGRLNVQAGAGIVADSVANLEWEETLNKAQAIVRAVELAVTGFKI